MSWRQDSHRIEAYPLVAYHGQGCDVCDFGSVFAHNDTVLGGQALEAQRHPRVRRVSLGTEDGGSGFSVSGLPMKNVAPLGEVFALFWQPFLAASSLSYPSPKWASGMGE